MLAPSGISAVAHSVTVSATMAETTENELGRVAAWPTVAAAKAPPKAPPHAPPQATISARIEMNLKRLEEKIDDTKEAMVAFQTQNRAIAKNQAVLNEQNKEILHLLHVQRINEQIARGTAHVSNISEAAA
jgi:hypothetical protein